MNSNLTSVLIIALIFFTTMMTIKSIIQFRIRSRIVNAGINDVSTIKNILMSYDNPFNNIKWALILFFGGLGLIVLSFIPYNEDSILPYGIEFIFLSFGFLAYYFLIKQTRSSK